MQAIAVTHTMPADSPTPGKTTTSLHTQSNDAPNRAETPTAYDRTAPPMMPGWPQTMPVDPWYVPAGVVLADLDGNGTKEVLVGSTDNNFYAWDYLGNLLPGWPVAFTAKIQSKAAVADLDLDGDLEIIISVETGHLHVLHHDGTPMTGWPQPSGLTFPFISPTLYDITGDMVPEILIGGGNAVRA